MIKHSLFLYLVISFLFTSCSKFSNEINLNADSFLISLDKKGAIQKLLDKRTGQNYIAKESPAPLISLRINNKICYPDTASFNKASKTISLIYENKIEAKIKAETKSTHLTFELVLVSNPENIELILWEPYPTTINKMIGETVGVVQEDFAIGIQALNPKTLGGYPWNENDCMPQLDIFEQDNFSDLNEQGKQYVLYRVEAAKPTDFGSTLQAIAVRLS